MTPASRGARLAIGDMVKTYGRVRALDDVSLQVEPGELLALLGPSGCGKTTLLKAIAGLIDPDSGAVTVNGRSMVGLPPNRRDMGMLFQNYALFPHLNVMQNVAFGLEMRRRPRAETADRCRAALDRVQLGAFADRMPRELSGGQQQRVALARAIVYEPTILLLDEPLAALDKNLREGMQMELRSLSRQLELTTVLVTHDQEEALTMADRIAVMRDGRIEQIDTSRRVYERPANRFVAGFVGTSNFFPVTVRARDDTGCTGVTEDGLPIRTSAGPLPLADGPLVATVRPEHVTLSGAPPDDPVNTVEGTLTQIVFRGGATTAVLRMDTGKEVLCTIPAGASADSLREGTRAWGRWASDRVLIINDN